MIKKFMKKICFIGIISIFLLISIVLLSSVPFCSEVITKLTSSQDYRLENMGPNEIIPDINNIKKNDGTKHLYIGDSVAYGILSGISEKPEDSTFACTNRAITLAGQYALIETYIKNHSDATDIYLMVINDSFSAHFDYQYGYQYAVMPFVLSDTIGSYSEGTITDIQDIYGDFCLDKSFINLLSQSPLDLKLYLNGLKYFSAEREIDEYGVSKEYLNKMIECCDENNISLHIFMAPMADTKERREQTRIIQEEFKNSLFIKRYPGFFDSVVYYPEEMFRDGTHLSNDILDDKRWKIIKEIELANSDKLNLEY